MRSIVLILYGEFVYPSVHVLYECVCRKPASVIRVYALDRFIFGYPVN